MLEHWPPEGGLITDQVGTWGVPLGIEEQITIVIGIGRRGGGLGLGRVAGQSWSRQRGSLSALACAAQGTLTDRAVPMYS